MSDKQEYRQLICEGRLDEALAALDSLIQRNPEDSNLIFERGKVRWRLGDRTGATGDYLRASEIDPESPAKFALEQARDIADFFNPDMYNP